MRIASQPHRAIGPHPPAVAVVGPSSLAVDGLAVVFGPETLVAVGDVVAREGQVDEAVVVHARLNVRAVCAWVISSKIDAVMFQIKSNATGWRQKSQKELGCR